MRLGRRPAAVSAAAALLVLGAAACGGGSSAAAPKPPASGARGGSTGTGSPSSAAPLGVGGSASAPPALPASRGTGSATPPPFRPTGSVDTAGATAPQALIGIVYDAWMADLSGLFANLTQPWLEAITEIATPTMSTAAQRSAGALQQAHDHALGTLVDSHRVVKVKGATASLTDCLDELHWYVVEDAGGKPDPSVTRGYFVGTADFVLTKGQWHVSSWNSHPERCAP